MEQSGLAHSFATAVFAATMLLSIPLVLGFFADRHPALDSVGHFRAHLAVLLAVGGLAAAGDAILEAGSAGCRARHGCTVDDAVVVSLSGPGQRRGRRASRRARGLPPHAAQPALRQPGARKGAVADRPGTAGRDHAQRGFGGMAAAAATDIGDVSLFRRMRRAGAERRRGDPVASADCLRRRRQMSIQRSPGNSADRLWRPAVGRRGAASGMAVAVQAARPA